MQTVAENESLASGQTAVSNFTASATTVHSDNSTLIIELRAKSKEQASHMKLLTALINSLARKSDGPQRIPPEIGPTVATELIEKLTLAKISRKLGSPTPTTRT